MPLMTGSSSGTAQEKPERQVNPVDESNAARPPQIKRKQIAKKDCIALDSL